jgi:glutamine synthetase
MDWNDPEAVKEYNLRFKQWRDHRAETIATFPESPRDLGSQHKSDLKDDQTVKAITVCFSDIEGRFHMLDYDKDYILASDDNLTFDGSSIRGFTNQNESDLRLALDWSAFYIAPPSVFGPGKVMVFSEIRDKDGHLYDCDIRAQLKLFLKEESQLGRFVNVAAEIEGFLFEGQNAEKIFYQSPEFHCVTTGGYFNTLPSSQLRSFIDKAAEAQRALGFENEKDHPEVAPAQFELNWKYTEALIAADQIQLYKMVCRVVADRMGYTASFLPKPLAGVNGNGMHTNISFHQTVLNKPTKNLMYDKATKDGISEWARKFADGILRRAKDICLVLNPSVNAYRRLDPHYEAPNEIFASAVDRGAMIRFPLCNEKSARVEVRSVSPDANPYLLLLVLLKAGLRGQQEELIPTDRPCELLPQNIHEAICGFNDNMFITEALGLDARRKYADWKEASADRCPKLLGKNIKPAEIMFHHEVTNQHLWQMF